MRKTLNYDVIKTLGEGGYGQALLVRRHSDRKLFVMKQVKMTTLSRREKQEALKEATILSVLKSPYIVSFVESFEERGNLYIVMEYADGGDLDIKIKKQKSKHKYFTEDVILNDFIQIALAIKFLHDRKVLHRDIKGQNVFLMSDGSIKLGDFGIAKVLQNTMQLAQSQIGTPYYLSPEICENKKYNSKTDIWSLGCLLYEMCTFSHPFDGRDMRSLMSRIKNSQPLPLPRLFSDNLRNLIYKMLSKDPNDRPTINQILGLPFIKQRLNNFLDKTMMEYEMSHTILHGSNILQQVQEAQKLAQQQQQQQQQNTQVHVHQIQEPQPPQQKPVENKLEAKLIQQQVQLQAQQNRIQSPQHAPPKKSPRQNYQYPQSQLRRNPSPSKGNGPQILNRPNNQISPSRQRSPQSRQRSPEARPRQVQGSADRDSNCPQQPPSRNEKISSPRRVRFTRFENLKRKLIEKERKRQEDAAKKIQEAININLSNNNQINNNNGRYAALFKQLHGDVERKRREARERLHAEEENRRRAILEGVKRSALEAKKKRDQDAQLERHKIAEANKKRLQIRNELLHPQNNHHQPNLQQVHQNLQQQIQRKVKVLKPRRKKKGKKSPEKKKGSKIECKRSESDPNIIANPPISFINNEITSSADNFNVGDLYSPSKPSPRWACNRNSNEKNQDSNNENQTNIPLKVENSNNTEIVQNQSCDNEEEDLHEEIDEHEEEDEEAKLLETHYGMAISINQALNLPDTNLDDEPEEGFESDSNNNEEEEDLIISNENNEKP